MIYCKSNSKNRKLNDNPNSYQLSENNGWHFVRYRDISAVPTDWEQVVHRDSIFISRRFLEVIEANPPIGIDFVYFIYYKENIPKGVFIGHIKHFNAAESIQINQDNFLTKLKSKIAEKVVFDTLICGNLLLTGEHGWYFNDESLSSDEIQSILAESIQICCESSNTALPLILIKDLTPKSSSVQNWGKDGYYRFDTEPCMYIDIPKEWQQFNDYLEALSTKYRTRAKRAFKKGEGIEKIELNAERIELWQSQIHELYQGIASEASFNLVQLSETYLLALKKAFPNEFRLFAYFLDGKLVAFYTTIKDGNAMEAYFLGYDKNLNQEKQIYLNILYDLIRRGIEMNVGRILMSRTALEIKSSVGAIPMPICCNIKHQSTFTNLLLPSIVNYLTTVAPWQPRKPFKDITIG